MWLFIWGLFTVFALDMRKREAYRRQAGSNLSVFLNNIFILEHDWLIQVSHIVSWIIANIKLDYSEAD